MTDRAWIGWAAGLFEGEGCIALLRFRKRTSVALCVSSTDLDVLQRFAEVVECGTIRTIGRGDKPAHHKTQYEWKIARRSEVEYVIDLLWPFLRSRRRDRITEIMAEVSPILTPEQRRKTHCPHGHVMTPENTYIYRNNRSCRRCRADRQIALRAA